MFLLKHKNMEAHKHTRKSQLVEQSKARVENVSQHCCGYRHVGLRECSIVSS